MRQGPTRRNPPEMPHPAPGPVTREDFLECWRILAKQNARVVAVARFGGLLRCEVVR